MPNKNIYSVKQLNSYLKKLISTDFLLSSVSIRGEVSNCKYHSSGHIYFTLKDDGGLIPCVMFASRRMGLSFKISNGAQIIATGAVDFYEKEGRCQLYVEEASLDGVGALYERYEALKKELQEQGLFHEDYKRPIPKYIRTLGVVTAPTGAAVRDIIQIAGRRNPYVQIILYPALVQGEGAPESIIRGIEALCDQNVDVIIAGRGGGSIEDLWAFNDERVAMAIFECPIPIISAVGHETDTTIADYVADLRAPTPSAAAELAVYEVRRLMDDLADARSEMTDAIMSRIGALRRKADAKADVLKYLSPISRLRQKQTSLMRYEERLKSSMDMVLRAKKSRLVQYAERFKGLSPLDRISGGYGMILDAEGHAVKSVKDVQPGRDIRIFIRDGVIDATVTETDHMALGSSYQIERTHDNG